MLSESLTKTKLTDPLILDLLQNIREHRSRLENLKSIKIDPDLTNIISNEIGKELYIENEFHKAKGFRKLHIEVAEFSKNLKILHCVFFPDPKFDIPIFGNFVSYSWRPLTKDPGQKLIRKHTLYDLLIRFKPIN